VADSEPAYPTFPVTQGTSRPISQESASSIGSLSKGFPGNDYRYKRKKEGWRLYAHSPEPNECRGGLQTRALQPQESPAHLSNSSAQPRFLVSSLKASRTFFVFQPNARKGDLYRWTVLSSRHGQFGTRRGLRDLQNDASIHLRSVVSRDGLGGARPECPASLCGNVRTASHRQSRGSQDSGYDSHDRRRLRIRNGLFPPSSRHLRTSRVSIRLRQFARTLHWQHKFHARARAPSGRPSCLARPCRHRHRSQRTLLLQLRAFRSRHAVL
jgi:hypothetical protein